ncbi:D-serine ammonia-lyase [Lacticaseibacillus parakribbianus]|uniref:D-serine ammonia-lyase n=1 Tax=Lacticaseibacillus parakribbianus TaxID=2970927 RepID=UPI0021CB385C|nr:D-serine ammonia-lyase [Lacticaseibacillus parakribbianus]
MNLEQLIQTAPVVADLAAQRETLWVNPDYGKPDPTLALTAADLFDAEARLHRFAPYMAKAFPETAAAGGILESPLRRIAAMQAHVTAREGYALPGALYLKADNELPISGSIKSRGGIYEVLKIAEQVAMQHGDLVYGDDYAKLADPAFTALFGRYGIAVGSTGNLGLSIGIVAAKLGFRTTVHMSQDAKQWKKTLLRQVGVTVVEYPGSFTKAITAGRKLAAADPRTFFIDDEGSKDLFLGYGVAAIRLQKQLRDQHIPVDADHPLFVYLPAGVGGSPGGTTFGLKTILGPHVHAVFAEPTHVPSVVLGMATGLNDGIAVEDIGLDGLTEADGLAVGRPSRLAGRVLKTLLWGIATFADDRIMAYTAEMMATENQFLEPSATAGFAALRMAQPALGRQFPLAAATHIVWATGGMLVPAAEHARNRRIGEAILNR